MPKRKPGYTPRAATRRYDSGDTKEMIQMCLNCTKSVCTNCIEFKKKDFKSLDVSKISLDRQKKFLNLYMECSSDAELSKRFGRAASFVCNCRHALDLPAYRSSTLEDRKYCAERKLDEIRAEEASRDST